MNTRLCLRAALVGCAVLAIAACGGGGDAAPAAATTTVTPAQAPFVSAYTSGLSTLNTASGLSASAFLDLFDSAYLDAGVSKTQLASNLQAEAVVVAASPDFPSFPMATLSGASITNCDATTRVCTLTATLTNNDADPTSTSFSTQVKVASDGKVTLLGDQAATGA